MKNLNLIKPLITFMMVFFVGNIIYAQQAVRNIHQEFLTFAKTIDINYGLKVTPVDGKSGVFIDRNSPESFNAIKVAYFKKREEEGRPLRQPGEVITAPKYEIITNP